MTSAGSDNGALWATFLARSTTVLRVSPTRDWKARAICVRLPGVYNGFFTSSLVIISATGPHLYAALFSKFLQHETASAQAL
jgi:hypothetical protein